MILRVLLCNMDIIMKYNCSLIILLVSICTSCKESAIDTFDEVLNIEEYEVICTDKVNPWGPVTDIEVIDNMIVMKHANDKCNFTFVDIANKEVMSRWGEVGEGPGEYLDFGTGFMIINSQLVFLDRMKKQINYVPITEILKGINGDFLNVTRETYPYIVDFRPFRINIVGNQKIVLGALKNGRFGVLDSLNNILPSNTEDPFDNNEIQGIYRGAVFQSEMKVNNKQKKFVIATFASDVFEIYQLSADSIYRTYMSPFKNIPKIWMKGGRYAINYDRSIGGLRNLAVSDELICFTYSTQTYNEVAKIDFASDEILCFDWNGKKIRKYILPFLVAKFCIDKNYIYGVSYQNEETVVYRFKL